jgi:peptidoglycan hydrolase-like protein with peptidoglycan-binding domain
MATLKKGSKGKPVEQLQNALNNQNPKPKPKLKIDGNFGTGTEAATIAFQKQNKLKPDGKVGEVTGFALGLSIGGIKAILPEICIY